MTTRFPTAFIAVLVALALAACQAAPKDEGGKRFAQGIHPEFTIGAMSIAASSRGTETAEPSKRKLKLKEAIGILAGAAIGGLSVTSFGGGMGKDLIIAAGALTGGYIGYLYGHRLGAGDRERAESAARAAYGMPVGSISSWRNPDEPIAGSTAPILEGMDDMGRFCRQYKHILTIGGETEEMHGTLCLQPNGQWRLIR